MQVIFEASDSYFEYLEIILYQYLIYVLICASFLPLSLFPSCHTTLSSKNAIMDGLQKCNNGWADISPVLRSIAIIPIYV